MVNANKSSYKWLISRGSVRRNKKREFNQRFNSTLDKLFPRTQPAPKQEAKNYDRLVKDLENNYSDKLASQDKLNQIRQQEADNKATKAISDLTNQVNQGKQQFKGLSEGVQKALNKIQADKSKTAQKANERPAPKANERPTEPVRTLDQTFFEDLKTIPATKVETEDVKKDDATNTASTANTEDAAPVDKVIKTSLNIKDHVPIGEGYTYKVTNLYGPRTGANAVAGREDGEHSRGIDITSHNASGSKVNIPIAIADGKIINVWKQGSGNTMTTKQGKSGGYVMDVLAPNGKVLTYMHLGKSIFDNKDQYIGRDLKRGEVINMDGGWSGSGSGKHIKISMSDVGTDGQPKRNYTDEGNDPTYLLLNGSYL